MAQTENPNTPATESRRSDLTGYAALIGESFSARVDLLQKLLQDVHYPSLGRYKERLLARTIKDFIPRRFDVGTGFVLFPHEDVNPPGGLLHADPLNRGAFAISRQCDILVYDTETVPPIFRDEDFVVLRPEAVRAVIEVKGALSITEVDSTLEAFVDFGRKWRTTQLFYKERHQPLTPRPSLLALAWRFQDRRGRAVTNAAAVRKRVAAYYTENVPMSDLEGFPVLSNLFVYNEADIYEVGYCDRPRGKFRIRKGWSSSDGRFIRFAPDGSAYRDRDRTIATLLSVVHVSLGREHFNRFFSYVDETRREDLVPYRHTGFSPWLDDVEDNIKRCNSDLV